MPRTAVTTPIRNLAQPYPLVNKLTDGDMEATNPAVALVDGNMEAATTVAWTANVSATLTKETGTPHSGTRVLRIAYGGGNNPFASQNILIEGHTYRVQGYARGDGTARPAVGNWTDRWTGTTSTSWQAFDFVFVQSTNTVFYLRAVTTGAAYCEFDDVTITDVTAGSYTGGNAAILSKDTTSPHGGSQYLKVAYGGSPSPNASQAVLTIGKPYLLSAWIKGDGAVTSYFLDGGSTVLAVGTTSTSWQKVYVKFVATGTSVRFVSNANSAGQYSGIDDLTVIDLTATPTRQLAQPFTIANKLVDGDMEAADTSAWTVSHLATLTKDSSVKNSGTQSLKVAYNGSGDPAAFQVVFTIGTRYRVRGVARGNGVVKPKIYSGSTLWTGAVTETWQKFDIVLTATTTRLYLMLNNGGAGDAVWFDDVEIIDLSATPMRLPATGRTNV